VWEETKPKRKVGRRVLAAIVTILLLGAGSLLAQLFAGRGGPAVETDPNLIAVLPLVPAEAGDTALAQAVAARIRADLDGIGSIRTVDDATIRVNESAFTGSLEDAAQWARSETGAGRLIQGSLTRIGDNEVGVELALYDSDGAMVARATGSGPPADPWVLADSLAWRLLDQVWILGEAGARNYYYPILLRGRPFTAAREYLLADRLFWDQLSFQQAAQAYERAFRADTTLWMASYVNDRLTRPGQFYDPGPRDSVVVSAWRDHVDDLPPAYQSWVEAWSVPFGSEASLARLQELRRPSATVPRGNFGPVLYQLADHLVHGGMRFGYSADYTIDVMEDAIAAGFGAELLDPTHLILAALGRDGPATRLWLDWRAGDGVPGWIRDRYRLIELVVGHLEDRVDSALMDSVVADWDLSGSLDDPNPFWTRVRSAGVPDLAIDIHRSVSSREMEREQRISLHFQAALAWADRGAWDSAQVGLRRLSDEACDQCDGIAFTLSAMGEWLGGLPPGSADEFRPGTVADVARWGDDCWDCTVLLASVDGMIAAGRKDLTMLRDALNRVDSATAADQRLGRIGSYVARSLRATESALLGDRAGAADSLYALVWQQHYPPWGWRGYGHVHAFNRLAAARWLRAEGDWARARAIVLELQLPWRQGHEWADDHQVVLVATGPAYLELARIEEFRGRDAIARDYYQQFLQRYDMPVEAHRPLVEEARAGYQRLGGGPGEFE